MQPEIGGPNFEFLAKLEETLKAAGFENVFVDRIAVEAGDHYESLIYRAIADCDLFVAVIGRNWLDILRAKTAAGEHDILAREIRAALDQEKLIVPLLIDGAIMPRLADLPEQIRYFHYSNGVPVKSSDGVEVITAKLKDRSRKVAQMRRRDSRWKRAYIIFAFVAYYLCAIQPHIIGVWEFGLQPWNGMAKAWSGLYIWPVFFLPFTLVAFYHPLMVMIKCVASASRPRDKLTYLAPLVLGTVVSLLAISLDVIGTYEAPWSIHPALPGCGDARTATSPALGILSSYDKASQSGAGPLQERYGEEFWLKDKCWPNVFFYLTVPVYQNTATEGYTRERPVVRRAFKATLNSKSVPYSKSFLPYVLSFTTLIWFGSTGIILSVFYVTVKIRRPGDDAILRLPSEDALLCLMYSFVTLMAWLPFRIQTIYFKKLYVCETLDPCDEAAMLYLNDLAVGSMLVIGFAFLSASLLVKYKRLALGFLGVMTIAILILGAFTVFHFGASIAALADSWQFYVAVCVPSVVIMFALGIQFDPSVVHFNDFKREIE